MVKLLSETSVQFVKGVGPGRAKLLEQLGVATVEDLFYLFPRRYEDRRNITPIAQVQLGEWHTIIGRVLLQGGRKSWYTRKHVLEVIVDDGGGRISCTWFNQPYLAHYFKEGAKVVCYGRVDMYKNKLQMISPEYEVIEGEEEDSLSLKRIVPIYPLTRGITQRYLRKMMAQCLERFHDELRDELPAVLRNKHHLMNIKRSIQAIHFPETLELQEEALKRISFEEFYFFQISIILRRLSITRKSGTQHLISDMQALNYVNGFSFELTRAQKKAVKDIRQDMERETPMLRLIQGDVGSGKTIVALFGCYAAFQNKCQSAFMAPTEILARQHYDTICRLIESGPLKGMKAALLLSQLTKKEREKTLSDIQAGKIDLVVGTHALITQDVMFRKLSFAVVDEQHKFGVRQRALLTEKGNNPDVLIMTATPIPRTLCITLYGDLDISIINELPKGRGKIMTELYPQEEADQVYMKVKDMVHQGRQAYIVYPIIEESENLDLKAAKDMYKNFEKNEFKDLRLALVHGQLKSKETEDILRKFKNGEIDVLVSTTVVEVGLDVPNASVMVIEHAERFGLAQLHQLRGRVGRGTFESHCYLISDPQTGDGIKRLETIVKTTDGFKIAQKDLEIRGPGRFFGRHQHGLNELKVANPATQLDILELARKEAIALIEDDPRIEKENNKYIKQVIQKRYPTYLNMVQAG